MKNNIALACFFIAFCGKYHSSAHPETFTNHIYNEAIKTVQVFPAGNPLGDPLIELGTTDALEFHYDELTTDLNTHSYTVLHCTHDWQLSSIEHTEYLDGFPSQSITEFEAAFNTQTDYVHHQFTFPNDMMKPRLSGNYLVLVFNGNDAEDRTQWLVAYRIIVYEQLVNIQMNATGTSLIAERYKAQDVDLTITHENLLITDPMRDIHVTLLQNMDWNNAIENLKPQFVMGNTLKYDYNMGENMFMAGAEFRHFEMKNLQYSSIEVEHIARDDEEWHVYLRPDIPNSKAYSTSIDINGNYYIKNDLADDSHLESEYVWVHFLLQIPEMPELKFSIEGRMNQFEKAWPCKYDDKLKGYTCVALLKQGYYNYRYLAENLYNKEKTLAYSEGNYSSTENNYHAITYWFDRARGCDRIIGLKADNSVR